MAEKYPEYTYKLLFAFNGTEYSGWQRPIGMITVQQILEDILRRLFHRETLAVSGCSRTDSGVHAIGMAASFRVDAKIPPEQLAAFLDKQLPHDIRIIHVEMMKEPFNAHSSSFGKSYLYAVHLGSHSIFLKNACWSWPDAPCLDEVRAAVERIAGTHDFQNFTGRKSDTATTVRTILRASIAEFGPILCFYFSGTGFLHKMVRRIVGFLHEIAIGNLTAEDFRKALTTPDCQICDVVAPPQGLYLKKVFYTEEEWKTDSVDHPPFLN